MPIKTYPCSTCDHVTELLLKMSDPTPSSTQCEKCGQEAVYKITSAPNFKLMGDYWTKPSLTNRRYNPL